MGLTLSCRGSCCQRDVIVTDQGETVSLTSEDFDLVDISPAQSEEFYLVPVERQMKYMVRGEPQTTRSRIWGIIAPHVPGKRPRSNSDPSPL
ncbi:myristylated tegument protein [Bovine alphaherpesvirus 2]|uniref:Myristylated tegument protein n=1 Tax=Bovine alphaherpesvirus 2 TaxID=10295 RepID=A0A7T1L7K2_9ALPH|nr:myristylated tegument protein [Bovine alphaherpesvirus 2]